MSIGQKTALIPLGGMDASSDPDFLSEGATRLMENVVFRPGRLEKRPAFIYAAIAALRGYASWLDNASGVERLVAAVFSGDSVDLRLQAADSETLDGAVAGPVADG